MALALELGPQAAMVVMDPLRHEILGLVGGYGYRLGSFDRSQRAHRQPGSAFKPFIYAAAIDSKRYTAASIINDSPEVFKLWKPQNHDKDNFRGPIRLRVALANSVNTVAIKLLSDVGVLAARDMATRAGLDLPPAEKLYLSLVLGTATVTSLELSNASFADVGLSGDARLVTAFGNEVARAPELPQSIRPETAYVTVSLMRSVIESGTARSAAPSSSARQPARPEPPTKCSAAERKAPTPPCPSGPNSWSRPWPAPRSPTSPSPPASWSRASIPRPTFLPPPAAKASTRSSSTAPPPPKPPPLPGEEATPDQILMEGLAGP